MMAENIDRAHSFEPSPERAVGQFEAAGMGWQVGMQPGAVGAANRVDRGAASKADMAPTAKWLSARETWIVVYIPILVLIALTYFVVSGH
jgi:hypothetical protein